MQPRQCCCLDWELARRKYAEGPCAEQGLQDWGVQPVKFPTRDRLKCTLSRCFQNEVGQDLTVPLFVRYPRITSLFSLLFRLCQLQIFRIPLGFYSSLVTSKITYVFILFSSVFFCGRPFFAVAPSFWVIGENPKNRVKHNNSLRQWGDP